MALNIPEHFTMTTYQQYQLLQNKIISCTISRQPIPSSLKKKNIRSHNKGTILYFTVDYLRILCYLQKVQEGKKIIKQYSLRSEFIVVDMNLEKIREISLKLQIYLSRLRINVSIKRLEKRPAQMLGKK